jgi:hydrogenase nickel incorporation protein HypA/HybF
MHEFSLVKREVERLEQRIKGKKVDKVIFSLGKLAHGTPDSIKKAFKTVTIDTPLSEVAFEVISIEPKIKCLSCGEILNIDNGFGLKCANCGSSSNELISGDECFISSVEVEK